ncbi:ankyrin repeat [Fusarium sp. NRRL 25303]|nr:ankyrin repeat [Fusarium sp. NRRL 25303]
MHWSVSIVQLGAVVFMTAARAAIRRGLAVPPRAQSLSQDFELEWLASTITGIDGSSLEIREIDSPVWINWVVLGDERFNLKSLEDGRKAAQGRAHSGDDRSQGGSQDDRDSMKEKDGESEDGSKYNSEDDSKDDSEDDSEGDSKDNGQAISNKEEGINDGVEEANRARADRDACNYSEDAQTSHGIDMEDEHHGGSVAARNNEGYTRATYSKPQTVLTLRSHFGEVTGWRSPVFAEANSLSRDIEVVMNTLFLESRLEHFDWQFKAMCSISGPQIVTVPMSLVKGNWRIHHSSDETSSVVEKSLVVGCGRATQQAVKLERIQLGDDYSDPPYGRTVEKRFLAVESFAPPAMLYALDLFSSFVRAVARAMEKPINGQGEVRPNDPGDLGSWTSFTLHNTLFSQMAGEIQTTDLATLSDVYSAIIPSLSIENKLPLVDPIIELAREHARPHEERGDMKKVTEVYLWLIRIARLFPRDTSFFSKSTVVMMEHLVQLIMSTELENRLGPIDLIPPDILERML